MCGFHAQRRSQEFARSAITHTGILREGPTNKMRSKTFSTDHVNETVITFLDSDDTANVFTHKDTWKRYFESQGIKPVRSQDCGGADYTVPKKWIKMPKGRAKRVMSDEQLIKLRERMSRARENRRSFKEVTG